MREARLEEYLVLTSVSRSSDEQSLGFTTFDFTLTTNQSLSVRVSESETACSAVVLHKVNSGGQCAELRDRVIR